MAKTIDDMKAELIENEYEFDIDIVSVVTAPNGWSFEADTSEILMFFNKAYAHLQEQRELEALRAENKELRAFVLDVEYTGARPHLTQGARSLVSKYNITADESEPDE